MFQVINWLCFICVSFLVLEIMLYLCKDAMLVFNSMDRKSKKINKGIGKTKVRASSYFYKDKIAK